MAEAAFSAGVKGGKWESVLYFVTDAGNSNKPIHKIPNEKLVKKFRRIVDEDEIIRSVGVYKLPLFEVIPPVEKIPVLEDLFHMFILFQTDEGWWSIEKCRDAIVLQRGEFWRDVWNKNRHAKRNRPIHLYVMDRGSRTVYDLVEQLYLTDELNKTYHVLNDNCQQFGKRVFDYLAMDLTLDMYDFMNSDDALTQIVRERLENKDRPQILTTNPSPQPTNVVTDMMVGIFRYFGTGRRSNCF